jgi:hypothetical protein
MAWHHAMHCAMHGCEHLRRTQVHHHQVWHVPAESFAEKGSVSFPSSAFVECMGDPVLVAMQPVCAQRQFMLLHRAQWQRINYHPSTMWPDLLLHSSAAAVN